MKKKEKEIPAEEKKEVVANIYSDEIIVAEPKKLYEFLLEAGFLNPMEKVMAYNLLESGLEFSIQKRLDLPEGTIINGRKYFVLDFFVYPNIVVETDGKIHENSNQVELDKDRDNYLNSLGYHVFRLSWDDVMQKNEDWSVIDLITSCSFSYPPKN